MPILNIREMGSIGVVSDVAPWDLPPPAFSDGMNFRLVSGKAQTTGGLESVSINAGQDIGHIAQSTDLKGNSSWLVCGERSILMFNGNDFYTLTGLAAERLKNTVNVDPSAWSSAKIGNVSFFNNPELTPVYWADEGESTTPSDLKYLPWHIGVDEEGNLATETWADVGMSCNIIRSHKNFLFALGIKNPDGQFNDMVHWSHPAEPNGIPFSWRPTIQQPDSIAGALSMGRGGAIISGESLRDSFVIYSEDALNVMDFTGDALGWRRRAISETAGLSNKNAIVEVKGTHLLFSGSDILSYDGNSLQSLMHNRLRSRLAANVNMDRIKNSWAAHYLAHNEVWFGVPENGADHPNYAYCYNYRDNTWSIRDLEKQVVHARSGKEPKAAYLTWEKSVTSWDEEGGSWTQAGDRPFREVMYGLADRKVNDLDPNMSTAGGGSADYSEQTWDELTGAFPDLRAGLPLEAWSDAAQGWDSDERKWLDVTIGEKPEVEREYTWYGHEGDWDDEEGPWHGATAPGGWDSYYEYSWNDASPLAGYQRSDTWLLRTDLPIGGHEVNTTITRVYPHVEGSAELEFRFGSQQFAGGPVRWVSGSRNFTPGKDRKIDVRTTGELHAFEVRSKEGFFKLTGMDIEYSMAGAR